MIRHTGYLRCAVSFIFKYNLLSFLDLDNIGVFNSSLPVPTNMQPEQAHVRGWMWRTLKQDGNSAAQLSFLLFL